MKSFFGLVGSLLSVVWVLLVLITPLLGVWLGSSLVSFHGGPPELAVAAGVLLFPVLPVLWDARSTVQWRKKLQRTRQLVGTPKRSMKAFDRIVLRTLILNAVLLVSLVIWFPKTAFSALATRGDWFLLDKQDGLSRTARGALFASAAGLEWLHELANPNPYKKAGDDAPVPESVKPVEVVTPTPPIRRWKKDPVDPIEPVEPPPVEEAVWTVGATVWPRPLIVHPAVQAMSGADEASIEAVGRHLAAREPDPFLRVKALHDWVVTRLTYDDDSLLPGKRKPQDAQSVFEGRTGVCEGYARLLVALGKVTGDQIVYVVGDVREATGEAAPVGHAWNTVEIKGSWYVLDATWDDPKVDGRAGNVYSTDYLFIPPSVAIFDHFPDDARWQLLSKPLTRGDFLRQPFARPGLARAGLTMVAPDRTRVELDGPLELRISNPRRVFVLATIAGRDSDQNEQCGVDDAQDVSLRCPIAAPGRYTATLFTNEVRSGTYRQVATLDIIRR